MKGPVEKFRYNKNGICAFHVTFPTGAQRLFQTISQDLQDVTELYLFLLLPRNSRHRLPYCNKATLTLQHPRSRKPDLQQDFSLQRRQLLLGRCGVDGTPRRTTPIFKTCESRTSL